MGVTSRFPKRTKRRAPFRATIELALANPHVGNPFDSMPARRIPVRRTPFSLVYAIKGDTIDILRVWDARPEPIRLNEKLT